MKSSGNDSLLTFGGHLEVFRRMLFRSIPSAGAIAGIVFRFKETFQSYEKKNRKNDNSTFFLYLCTKHLAFAV